MPNPNPSTASRVVADQRKASEATGLGWLLWAIASALPWLLPTHSDPWTTFHTEVLMAAVMVPLAAWAVWRDRGPWRVDVLAAAFALAAAVPLAQALSGMFNIPTEAPLVAFYLLAMALTMLVARRAEVAAPSRLVDALFSGLAIAALASTGMALCQWLGLDPFSVLLAPSPIGARPTANVGQPNNLSTLLVWGLVAIWWAHSRRHIGGLGAFVAAAFLLAGVALTQSRTGWLAVAMLGFAAWRGRRTLRSAEHPVAWLALAAWFMVCVVALPPLSQALLIEAPRALDSASSAQSRIPIWKMSLAAIEKHPWAGYGWNQSVTAHVELADRFAMHGTVGHAHNLALDLMVWNGVPLGALMLAGLAWWLWHQWRGDPGAEQRLLLLALAVLLLHAMLELPHVLAYFLLPAAVIMGSLNAYRPLPRVLIVPRLAIGAVVLMLAAALLLMFDEYLDIEARSLNARMLAAHIAVVPSQEPDTLVLRSLQSAMLTLRTEPRRAMDAGELERMRRAVTRYPNPAALFRYAQASGLNGRAEESKWAIGVLCALHPIQVCREATKGLAELAASGYSQTSPSALPLDMVPAAPR